MIGKDAVGGGDNTAVIGNADITAWLPPDDNGVDLGSSSKEFKNVYVDGVTYTDAVGFGTVVMTLPTADGSADQVLKTDGSGALSWTDAGGGAATKIDDLSDAKSEGTGFTGSLLIGHQTTGSLNNAQYNTGVGLAALDAITTGDANTAVGHQALTANTTGESNTASGRSALSSNTTGNYNTASGANTLYANTTGSYNTASGAGALVANTTGDYNTASGYSALYANTTELVTQQVDIMFY